MEVALSNGKLLIHSRYLHFFKIYCEFFSLQTVSIIGIVISKHNMQKLLAYLSTRQEQRVGHFRDFLAHLCFFLQFIYNKFNLQLIGISWSSGLRHQDSNKVILQVCGSIPSPAQYFFIKLIFHELLFSFLKFIKNIFMFLIAYFQFF